MNCKPGDLCVIVRSDFPDSVGVLCLVLKANDIDEDGDWQWLCRTRSSIKWEHCETGKEQIGKNGYIPDAWLRPIVPPPGTVTTDEVRELYSPKQTEAA